MLDKWFAFGVDDAYDDAVREIQRGDYSRAIELLALVAGRRTPEAVRRAARRKLVSCARSVAESSLRSGNSQPAIDSLDLALQFEPNYPDIRLLLARNLDLHGDVQRAKDQVSLALDLNREFAEARLFQGYLLLKGGTPPSGWEIAEQAVREDSRLDTAEWSVAKDAASRGDWAAAVDWLRRVRPDPQQDPNLLAAEAELRATSGDSEAAMQLYRRALQRAPQYADVRVRLAEVLLDMGQIDEAMREAETAASDNPGYAHAKSVLGVVLRRTGDEDAALTAFRAALVLDPNDPIASIEALRRRRY